MSSERPKPQSIGSLIFDFFKLVAALIFVLVIVIPYMMTHDTGPSLIQTTYNAIADNLANPAPWLVKTIVFVFGGLLAMGSYVYSREHPEEGSFAWILFKSSMALLFGLPLFAIIVFIVYRLVLG